MNWRLQDLTIFASVVETLSFTETSRALGIPRPTVSRRIAELEEEVGVPLLWRTTRRMGLTDAGATFREQCRRILETLAEAERALGETTGEPRGTLRITAPHMLGAMVLSEAVSQTLAAHPAMRIDVSISDRYVDIRTEGYDLALRMGAVGDESLVARKIGTVRLLLCCSPDFLASIDPPAEPNDLTQVAFLGFSTGATPRLQLKSARRAVEITPRCRLVSGDHRILLRAACQGLGIALLPSPFCAEAVEAGHLVTLLDDWSAGEGDVHLVYRTASESSPRLRAFLKVFDALGARLDL